MKRILLVDDEQPFLRSLSDGLASFASLQILTAKDGQEAIQVLESKPIDLVVTDLQMPGMGGFELLAYLSRNHPNLPVVVMTAFASQSTHEKVERLGALACLDKPIDFDELADKIFETLLQRQRSSLRGISVASFLQLVNMERLSCRLWVSKDGQTGWLVLSEGQLVGAKLGETTGDDAACTMIAWEEAVIDLEKTEPVAEQTAKSDLGFVIMESLRRADERRATLQPQQRPSVPVTQDEWMDLKLDSSSSAPPPSNVSQWPSTWTQIKENPMAIEKHLQTLRDINGYKASAIMNFTGEPLAVDTVDAAVDLALVGATFNDIFRAAHEASKKIGLDATREAVFKTAKGLVIMQCSGVDSKVHFHMIAVLSADGNQALAKMRLDQAIPRIMAEL